MQFTYQMWLFLTFLWIIFVQGDVILEKILCKSLDKKRLKFLECGMKMVTPRKPKLGFIHAQLLQPIHNCMLEVQFLKKSNNQVYNSYFTKAILFDACKFMESKEMSQLQNYIYQFLAPYTNINHTCPYMGDIYLRNYKVEQQKITYLPIPEGEYAFYSTWKSCKMLFADVKMFITVR